MRDSVSAPSERRLVWALAALYVLLHLPFLAPSLEDIDSINFALGLRDYDVARHQPHPPGYPVFMGLARLSDAALGVVAPSLPAVRREALALAIWSALSGGVAIVAAWAFFRVLSRGDTRASLWAAAFLAVTPLFWMTGLRPMSDMTGLAFALSAQALILPGFSDRRALVAGAVVAGLAAGVRVQTVWLTMPLLAAALVAQRGAGVAWLLTRPIAALAVAGLAWGIPLLAASGGFAGYLAALGSQAGEDFAWVDMVLFNPTPRRIAFALIETFLLPWGVMAIAAAVLVTAAAGGVVMALRERRELALLAIAFAPYGVFHLLLQETFQVRYALPVIPAVVWLAARPLSSLMRSRLTLAAAVVPIVLVAALRTIPAALAYGGESHPAFRAIDEATRSVAAGAGPARVFSHFSLRRPLQAAPIAGATVIEPRRSYEWLDLVDYWVAGGREPVWFFADPRRTDLALIDPRSWRTAGARRREYRWRAGGYPELGGARPAGVDWYRFTDLPNWFLAEGWALTPETGGLARATTMGVDHVPIEAYVRRREGPMQVMVGVRHLGHSGEVPTVFEMTIDGTAIDRWTLDPATNVNDLRFIDLPALPPGEGDLALLSISARPAVAGRPIAEVAVRQFDIQPAGTLVWGFGDGWHEAEYETATGLSWRWTSERSLLRVRPDRSVTIRVRGESPLRYVTTVPTVRVTAAGRTIAETRPDGDFRWSVTVPAADVEAAGGAIAIETDQVYLPGAAEGTADVRRLGLRLFEISVDPGTP